MVDTLLGIKGILGKSKFLLKLEKKNEHGGYGAGFTEVAPEQAYFHNSP